MIDLIMVGLETVQETKHRGVWIEVAAVLQCSSCLKVSEKAMTERDCLSLGVAGECRLTMREESWF